MTFKDAKGRTYSPRITVQTLREYEARAQVEVFNVLLSFASETMKAKAEDPAALKYQTIDLMRRLFPSADAVFFLAYRSSLADGQAFTEEGFRDFCENMGGKEAVDAFNAVVAAAQEHAEITGLIEKLKAKMEAKPEVA